MAPSLNQEAYLTSLQVLSPLCCVFQLKFLGASYFLGIWNFLVAIDSSPSATDIYLCSISWPSVFLTPLSPFFSPPSLSLTRQCGQYLFCKLLRRWDELLLINIVCTVLVCSAHALVCIWRLKDIFVKLILCFHFFYGFQRLNSGHKAYTVRAFRVWAKSLAQDEMLLIDF